MSGKAETGAGCNLKRVLGCWMQLLEKRACSETAGDQQPDLHTVDRITSTTWTG